MVKLWIWMIVSLLSGCMRPYYLDMTNNSGAEVSAVRADGYAVVTIAAGAVGRVPYFPASRCLFIKSQRGLGEYVLNTPDTNYFQGSRVLNAVYSPDLEIILLLQGASSGSKVVIRDGGCIAALLSRD